MSKNLTHIDANGKAKMVNISSKNITKRIASASGVVHMKPSTLQLISEGGIKKGDVFTVAKVAGISAAKKTYELIPMCHQITLEAVEILFESDIKRGMVIITSEVVVTAKTGAEMEALQSVAQAALTLYDMCKAVDKEMVISDIKLLKKSGGKSGEWIREG